MAYIFSLSAECGADKTQAETFAKHFEDLSFTLVTGTFSNCRTWIHQDKETNFGVSIIPDNVTDTGIGDEKDCIELSELGLRLYKHLLNAPPFRYALAGVEVDQFNYYSNLFKSVCTYPDGRKALHGFAGLVLRKDIWQEMGEPISFYKFKKDYVWQIYKGEEYSLMLGQKELLKLWKNLTPTYNPKTNTWECLYLENE